MKAFLVLLGFFLFLVLPTDALPHGGGLDKFGCHHNRKIGGYHCHRGPLAGQVFSSKEEMLAKLKEQERLEPTQKKQGQKRE